ncbi:MAG: hypothetical protein ACLU4N_11335 [Butyricimonas faecihominis]
MIVVGCDLRNPSLHNFDFDRQEGCLPIWGLCDTRSVNLAGNEELYVCLGSAPNPVQLIASPRMQELLESERKYSCIILTPPLGCWQKVLLE